MLSSIARRATSNSLRFSTRTVARRLSTEAKEPAVVVPLTTDSLEWTLSSPPPLHQFIEPPIFVETDHLTVHPGVDVHDALKAQGESVSDTVGLDAWEQKDEAEFEGKIPQNEDWTEFVEVAKK
mmetsp:Transcript_53123/g.63980  ORF Transcript_53123/g.63980 Transcript_53123/m.63980 type:complete len:124 (-) Transcript_53123:187-558(-)|eukprot:CAMPEP_0172485396 /NCGR_PEP_ID=MMETSP1066-20121228/13462_1 /TAXON_ID=671091 /ORGANISM="Coscinodiscus wailesii, Strain CCMP2513" /LENGTH=123 /DNA_ID=CAMNT_0013250669 /DNA_START=192 /DNA_END=563 /DNA_ORIENTATION=+